MRILAGILLIFITFVAPWWWTVILAIIGMIAFDGYVEAFVVGTILIMRAYPHMLFAERLQWFGFLFLVWVVAAYMTYQIHGRDRSLYA